MQRLLGEQADVREGHPFTFSAGKPFTLPDHSEPQPDLAISLRYPQGVVQPLDQAYLEHHPYPKNIL